MSEIGSGVTDARGLPPLWLYPERTASTPDWRDRALRIWAAGTLNVKKRLRRDTGHAVLRYVAARGNALERMSVAESVARLSAVRARLRLQGLTDDSVAEALALLSEIAQRRLGQRPSATQLRAAVAMLYCRIADIDRSGSNALAVALAAATAGLAGMPVHVIRDEDRHAEHDAAITKPFFAALGLRAGVVTSETDLQQRRTAYASDIVYVSAREVAFDHLRDRAAMGSRPRNVREKLRRVSGESGKGSPTLLQGLHFAIVDDADVVLVAAACTPLMLSRDDPVERQIVARQTFQRFFLRYRKLAGISATAQEAAGVLAAVYGLTVEAVASKWSVRQSRHAVKLCRTSEQRSAAITERTAALVARDRSVLIGMQSDDRARELARQFDDAGIAHVLVDGGADADSDNAVRSAQIAQASLPGRVTIVVRPESAAATAVAAGDLHVIVGEADAAARAQHMLLRSGTTALAGSAICADRAGFDVIVSLEDSALAASEPSMWCFIARRCGWLRHHAGAFLMRRIYARLRRTQRRIRVQLAGAESALDRTLAMAGGSE